MPSRKENITYRSLLTEAIRSDGEYGQLMSELRTRRKKNLPLMATGLCRGASIALCAAVCEDMPDRAPVLFLCPEERDCLSLCGCFDVLGIKAGFYPLRDFNFINVTSSREFEQQRLRVLAQISRGELNAVVSTPDAVLQYTVPKEKLPEFTAEIGTDSCIPPDELCAKLTKAGYVRSEMAEGPGQYARRGGIIDICMPGDSADSASSGNALRIEFFDDEIDRMCFFDPATQRVTGNTPFAVIPPAREVIPGAEALAEIEKSISSLLKKAEDPEIRGRLEDELSAVKLCRSSGSELNFADKYISLIYPGKACLLDWLPSSSLHVHVGNAAVSERLKSYLWRLDEETKDMVESGLISGKYALYSERDNKLNYVPEDGKVLLIDSLMQGMTGREVAGIFGFRTKHSTGIAGSNDMLLDELSDYSAGGYRMVFMAGGNTQAQNYASLIAGRDIPARASERPDGSDIPLSIMQKGSAAVIPSSPVPPFELPGPRIAFISAAADYERPREKRRAEKTSKKSEAARILSYADLKPGDYVVHENHGIGIFDGITTVTTAGVTADYIAIRYAGTDRLYLPVDKLDKISKYIGAKSDDGTLKLSKFGGTEWGKTKARAKAALKDIAKDLIKLYAERLRRPGFAFPADDDFQRDFETAFEYDETDAQLKAAGEIKRDMERPVPMDRLLCGDVGYGKTEVAFRAIYKAICGGRQVALLVPTTILAMQHFQTAESRMRPFCVNTGVLSRFVPSKEQKRVISGAESGDIDLLIGTHRLLSKDIKFKNLGLLVIDEEQRFGVAQKEKIKQMAGNIDVLSLSATPIPRTLNMAMTGIRDISLLDEAPVDRLPV